MSRTRATLRSAEFGFFGVVVYTRVHTPRRCGHPFSAGVLLLLTLALRPLRTSCWMVGTGSASPFGLAAAPSFVFLLYRLLYVWTGSCRLSPTPAVGRVARRRMPPVVLSGGCRPVVLGGGCRPSCSATDAAVVPNVLRADSRTDCQTGLAGTRAASPA